MATASEVLTLEELHQAAQSRLGLLAAYLSLAEWETVSALNAAATATEWLARSLRVIVAIRKMSRELAISYYQLSRALETGRTLGVPEGSTGDVTLGDLRKNFRDNVLDVASLPSSLFVRVDGREATTSSMSPPSHQHVPKVTIRTSGGSRNSYGRRTTETPRTPVRSGCEAADR